MNSSGIFQLSPYPVLSSADLRMTVQPRSLRIYPGATALVECSADYYDKTIVSAAFFREDGTRVTGRGRTWSAVDRSNQHVTLRLHFYSVRPEDAGRYECRVATLNAERRETVRVLVAPKRTGGERKGLVTCSAVGYCCIFF